MRLPVMPPVRPMLAKALDTLPDGELLFEPKWDGFRCIVFRDGDEVELGSRNERPLTRYFPEILEPLRQSLPTRCVVDGELVVATGGRLDFEALQQRLHPAASRVNRLAVETPASFVAFDLLALDDLDLTPLAFRERRGALESLAAAFVAPVHCTPATRHRATAADWFERFEGAGLDGVMAPGGSQPSTQLPLQTIAAHPRFASYPRGETLPVHAMTLWQSAPCWIATQFATDCPPSGSGAPA